MSYKKGKVHPHACGGYGDNSLTPMQDARFTPTHVGDILKNFPVFLEFYQLNPLEVFNRSLGIAMQTQCIALLVIH